MTARIAAASFPFLALLLLTGCGPAADQSAERAAFVVRIQPADYASAELPFEEALSRSYDLVFLRTDFGQPVSALALRAEPAGGYTLYFGATDSNGAWQKIITDLDQKVGLQVMQAVELKLHRHIFVDGQRHDVTKNDGDLWVQQKLSDGRLAAAMIPLERTLGNPEARAFVDDFLGGLQQLAHLDPAARGEVLTRIDRIATEIIFAETPQQRTPSPAR